METSPEELEKTAKTSTQIGLFGDPLSVLIVILLSFSDILFKIFEKIRKIAAGTT